MNDVSAGIGRLAHAAADHPPVKQAKIGVLLANLGTPDGYDYWSMRRYLSEFLSDKRVVDIANWKWQPLLQLIILSKRPFTSGANYKLIWNHEKGESPLMTITKDQTAAIAAAMQAAHGDQVMVDFAMRYGNPSMESVLKKLEAKGMERLLILPLYPQYSATTTASTFDEVFRIVSGWRNQPELRLIKHYHDHPSYINALKEQVESYWQSHGRPDFAAGDKLLFSFHGVPKRTLDKGDPYHCE